jgi:hypothetical protein
MKHINRAAAALLFPYVAIGAFAGTAFAQTGPFSGMPGAWSGSGTISLADGSRERIRCRANYTMNGPNGLRQSLRCASDSYKFELASDVVSEGERISGSWSETSRGVSGGLQGRVVGPHMSVSADAPGFSANISLETRGNRQSVSISSAGDIRNVSISMARF